MNITGCPHVPIVEPAGEAKNKIWDDLGEGPGQFTSDQTKRGNTMISRGTGCRDWFRFVVVVGRGFSCCEASGRRGDTRLRTC